MSGASGSNLAYDAHLHPVSHPMVLAAEGPRTMVRGDGCYLYDSDGNRFFDAIAGLASVPIGYSNRHVAEAAIGQMMALPYYHSFFHMGNLPSQRLAAKLREITPDRIEQFFFTSSGSEAVESAVKIAWQYWRAKGERGKRAIISRDHGYHGNTIFATMLTGIEHYQDGFGIDAATERRIAAPYRLALARNEDPERFGERAALWLEARINELGAGTVAAFIGEPIQGTGGGITPPESYWPRIREICDRHDVLLIADEVMTGFGRLGAWFGQDSFAFEADMMTMSKGLTSSYLPLAAVGMSGEIASTLRNSGEFFVHGFTASAHPTCAAVALANIDVLEREALVERVRDDIGPYFRKGLASLIEPLEAVAEIRGRGLMLAVELDTARYQASASLDPHDLAAPIVADMLQRGFILRNNGATLMLSPPFIMTHEQADDLVAALADAITNFDRMSLA
jgi:putrescine---pyruvate transaminase